VSDERLEQIRREHNSWCKPENCDRLYLLSLVDQWQTEADEQTDANVRLRVRLDRQQAVVEAARAYLAERDKDEWGDDEVLLARQAKCRWAIADALAALTKEEL
jgi:hypothetical protein